MFQNIIDAFIEGVVTLPSIIGQTGLPGTTTVSFSPIKEQEPIKGVLFPRGFYLKGNWNLLGYTGRLEINIDPGNGFKADTEFAPLTIGGDLLQLTRSSQEMNKGPYVKIDALGPRAAMPMIRGQGRISMFAKIIQAETNIDIVVPNRFLVSFSANFFVLEASVNITSILSSRGWGAMPVIVDVRFSGLDIIQKFIAKVLAQVSAWCQDAVKALAEAQADVQRASQKVKETLTSVCEPGKCESKVPTFGCKEWAQKITCIPRKKCPWYNLWCHLKNLFSKLCGWAKEVITVGTCEGFGSLRKPRKSDLVLNLIPYSYLSGSAKRRAGSSGPSSRPPAPSLAVLLSPPTSSPKPPPNSPSWLSKWPKPS